MAELFESESSKKYLHRFLQKSLIDYKTKYQKTIKEVGRQYMVYVKYVSQATPYQDKAMDKNRQNQRRQNQRKAS